jgi:hypothetical protein
MTVAKHVSNSIQNGSCLHLRFKSNNLYVIENPSREVFQLFTQFIKFIFRAIIIVNQCDVQLRMKIDELAISGSKKNEVEKSS